MRWSRLTGRVERTMTRIAPIIPTSHVCAEDVRRRERRDCFETFACDVDPKYGEYRERCLAFDVVELLGWRTVDSFNVDLVSLG